MNQEVTLLGKLIIIVTFNPFYCRYFQEHVYMYCKSEILSRNPSPRNWNPSYIFTVLIVMSVEKCFQRWWIITI